MERSTNPGRSGYPGGSAAWAIRLLRLAAVLVATAAIIAADRLVALTHAERTLVAVGEGSSVGDILAMLGLALPLIGASVLMAVYWYRRAARLVPPPPPSSPEPWWLHARPATDIPAPPRPVLPPRFVTRGRPTRPLLLRPLFAIPDRLGALRWAWTGAPDRAFDVLLGLASVTAIALLVGIAIVGSESVRPMDGPEIRVQAAVVTLVLALALTEIVLASCILGRLAWALRARLVVARSRAGDGPVVPIDRRERVLFVVAPIVAMAAFAFLLTSDLGAERRVGCGASLCQTVIVAHDHGHPDDGRTITLTYRVVPATGHRQGTLVVAVGGPGASGLVEADDRLDEIDSHIRDAFDIVFFDQRGLGQSGALRCPQTLDRYDDIDGNAADDFARSCVDELGVDPAILRDFATSQAAEDIEAIRDQLGLERFVLYGESYGTRLAQAYAAAHPDRLSGLILDAPVDAQSEGFAFWAESSAGFDHSLEQVSTTCLDDEACKGDMQGATPRDVLADLLERADRHDLTVDNPNGQRIEVTSTDIVDVVGEALYTPADRMVVLRALAQSKTGRYSLLARLVALERSRLPEVGRGRLAQRTQADEQAFSTVAYYLIQCADHAYPRGVEGERRFREERSRSEGAGTFFGSLVSQDLPCAFWPDAGARSPDYLARPDVPTLVLAATADPITPPDNARRIVARLPHAGLVLTEGGPHVTWRRDASCVNDAITAFLRNAALPPGGSTSCSGEIIDPYVPILPVSVARMSSLDTFDLMVGDVFSLPEFVAWDGSEPVTVECDYGGVLTISSGTGGDEDTIGLAFANCRPARDLSLAGSGTYNTVTGEVTLEFDDDGDRVTYRLDRTGMSSLVGRFRDRAVDEHH